MAIDTARILDDVIELLARFARQRQVTLAWCDERHLIPVEIDNEEATEVRRVVHSFVFRAVLLSDPGSVVQLSAHPSPADARRVTISVRDCCGGLGAAELRQLADSVAHIEVADVQVAPGDRRRALVLRSRLKHPNGDLTIETAGGPGRGTVIRLEVPAVIAAP